MTGERKGEIKNCLQLLLFDQSSKVKENGEIICCVLFFQYYLSVYFEKQIGQEISFAALYERVEKGRFQWSFYKKWMKNFSDFLYLMTGRQEAATLFDFVNAEEKEEQRGLERFMRKGIRSLFHLELKKEEAKEGLEIFLKLFYQKEEAKNEIPKELSDSLVKILLQEQKKRKKATELILFGTGKGSLPVGLKNKNPSIIIRGEEANIIWDGLSHLIYFVMDLTKRWVLPLEEKEIEIGVSLWPFGTTIKREGETLSVSGFSNQKEEYKNLGTWLLKLTETGVFYFLCSVGFLYREGKEKGLRRYFIEEKNYLDGIFVLPNSLWKPGASELVLLCFRKNRVDREPIYLLDGSKEEAASMDRLTECFLEKRQKQNLTCFIRQDQIKTQEMNLNPARYLKIQSWKETSSTDVEKIEKRLSEIEVRLEQIEKQRKLYMLELTLGLSSDKNSV